jgi:hypothetical protein
MFIEVVLTRSKEWLAAKRLETGENIPRTIRATIDTQAMSQEIRAMLMGSGEYPKEYRMHVTFAWELTHLSCYSYRDIILDVESPTQEEIALAILSTRAAIYLEREKYLEEQRKRDEAEAARAAAKQARDQAREWFKDDFDYLNETIRELKADRLTLANFLSNFSDEVLWKVVNELASSGESTAQKIADKVVSASPVQIFSPDPA